jgi:putative ABC transport system permease protein
MFKNYFKIARRDLLNDKTSSIISIAGLAIGMACCMLIFIHVEDELSYNKFNGNYDNIYRINWIAKTNSGTTVFSSTPVPFSKDITLKIPGIEQVAKSYQRSGEMETKKNTGLDVKRFQEQGVYFVDQEVFKIFSIPFLAGDKTTALSAPYKVVLTDEMAKKYFGDENPIGKMLFFENKALLQVTGVVKKMPANSDIQFDFLVSFETAYHVESPFFADFIKNDWTFTPCDTWILLRPGQHPANIQKALNQHLRQGGTDRNRQLNSVVLQPLDKVHLYASNVVGNNGSSSGRDITYIYVFAGVAFLILLIANVNFINLSVARSINERFWALKRNNW